MKLVYNVTGAERKALVGAISQELNTPTKYLGAPTFAYEVGGYHIDKEGTVTGADDFDLEARVHQHGFDAVIREYDAPDTHESCLGDSEMTPALEECPAEVPDPKKRGILDILVDELNANETDGGHWERLHRTPAIIDNSGREHNLDGTFANTMSAYESQKPAEHKELELGQEHRDPCGEDGTQESDAPETDDENESCRLVIEMPLTGFTPEKLDNLAKLVNAKAPLLKAALDTDNLSIQQTESTLKFPWFGDGLDAETVKAYASLIGMICAAAKEKHRVTAHEKDPANKKYAMRCWLLSLGFIGDEYKASRKILLSKLDGNSSFKNGAPPKATENEAI